MDAKLPEPPEIELTTVAEAKDDEEDCEQPGNLEVEKVVQHVSHADGTSDYKLKWNRSGRAMTTQKMTPCTMRQTAVTA